MRKFWQETLCGLGGGGNWQVMGHSNTRMRRLCSAVQNAIGQVWMFPTVCKMSLEILPEGKCWSCMCSLWVERAERLEFWLMLIFFLSSTPHFCPPQSLQTQSRACLSSHTQTDDHQFSISPPLPHLGLWRVRELPILLISVRPHPTLVLADNI